LTKDAKDFVQRTTIRHLQFTMDGPRQYHDRQRRYVSKTPETVSSYDKIVETIDRLIGFVRIYLRIKVNPWIGRDAMSLVEFLERERMV